MPKGPKGESLQENLERAQDKVKRRQAREAARIKRLTPTTTQPNALKLAKDAVGLGKKDLAKP